MAQETTGSRADPLAITGIEPIDWERRVAAARLRREATLSGRPSQSPPFDARGLPPRASLPARSARLPAPPRPAGPDMPAPATRPAHAPVPAARAPLAAAASAARRRPGVAAAALAGILVLVGSWLDSGPEPVESAALAPAVSEGTTAVPPARPPLPQANRVPAPDPLPVPPLPVPPLPEPPLTGPPLPPLAAAAGLPGVLALPAAGQGARGRTPAAAAFELSARTAAADLLAAPLPAAYSAADPGVDAALLRGLVAAAIAE